MAPYGREYMYEASDVPWRIVDEPTTKQTSYQWIFVRYFKILGVL
jgi:hypothetical protein